MEENVAVQPEPAPGSPVDVPSKTQDVALDSAPPSADVGVDDISYAIEQPEDGGVPEPSSSTAQGSSTSTQCAPVPERAPDQLSSYNNIQVQPCDTHGGPNYYEITSVTRNGESVVARRRFDDLVQLHEDLKKRFRGCVIPFRPGKTIANSSMLRTHSDNFLRARAYAIKCYLHKVVQHPEMKESTNLSQFMESSEVLRDSAMWAREQVKQVGVVGGFLTSVKKMTGAVPRIPTPSQVLQGSGQSEHDLVRQMAEMRVNRRSLQNHADPGISTSCHRTPSKNVWLEAERVLLDLGDKFTDMLKANHAMSGAASTLMDASRALLDSHADNGHGLHTLKNFEKDASVSVDLRFPEDAITTMAAAVDAFGRCCGDAMKKALMHQMAVLEPLNDHAYTLPRVEKALAARVDALVVLESLRRQEGVINASYQQLHAKEVSGSMRNSDVTRMNRIRSEVDQVQQAKAAGEQAYSMLKDRNERDIQLYQSERSSAFSFMAFKFAEAQAALQDAVADVWEAMARRSGVDPDAMGDDMQGLAYADLGLQVSHSAVLYDGDMVDAVHTSAPEGPLPTEHAEITGTDDSA